MGADGRGEGVWLFPSTCNLTYIGAGPSRISGCESLLGRGSAFYLELIDRFTYVEINEWQLATGLRYGVQSSRYERVFLT